jgi:hypothetical protein
MNNPNASSGTTQHPSPKRVLARARSSPKLARRGLASGIREADHPRLFATAPDSKKRTRTSVVHAHGQWHILALQSFVEGEEILALDGELVSRPSRYSVQVDDALHVEIPAAESADLEHVFEAYPWRFLNHSCAPSARVEGRALLALRDLAAWEEVTFDYNTTEYRMASPFVCRCGHCGGRKIGGFARLARAEQERLRPNLAPHLRRRLDLADK